MCGQSGASGIMVLSKGWEGGLRRLLPHHLGWSRWKGGVNNQVRHHQPCWNILCAEENICCYVNVDCSRQWEEKVLVPF